VTISSILTLLYKLLVEIHAQRQKNLESAQILVSKFVRKNIKSLHLAGQGVEPGRHSTFLFILDEISIL